MPRSTILDLGKSCDRNLGFWGQSKRLEGAILGRLDYCFFRDTLALGFLRGGANLVKRLIEWKNTLRSSKDLVRFFFDFLQIPSLPLFSTSATVGKFFWRHSFDQPLY